MLLKLGFITALCLGLCHGRTVNTAPDPDDFADVRGFEAEELRERYDEETAEEIIAKWYADEDEDEGAEQDNEAMENDKSKTAPEKWEKREDCSACPCKNNAWCINTPSNSEIGFQCRCPRGMSGQRCENIDKKHYMSCSSNPCARTGRGKCYDYECDGGGASCIHCDSSGNTCTKTVSEGPCVFAPGEGINGNNGINGDIYVEDSKDEKTCIKKCIERQRTNPAINGLAVSTNGEHCYCEANMIGRSERGKEHWKSCYLKKIPVPTEAPPPTCGPFAPGDGINDFNGVNGDIYVEDSKDEKTCIKKCIEKQKTNVAINGVAVSTNGQHCFCQANMIGRHKEKANREHWKSCYLGGAPTAPPAPTKRCQGETHDGCCTRETPCGAGEGDCDGKPGTNQRGHCKEGLVCGSNNCGGEPFSRYDDCCYDPNDVP